MVSCLVVLRQNYFNYLNILFPVITKGDYPSRILGGEMRDSMIALEISGRDQVGEKKNKSKQKPVTVVCDNNQGTKEMILKEIMPKSVI